METLLRIVTSGVEFEVEGSEEFVRRQTARFLPDLDGSRAEEERREAVSPFRAWYDARVPRGHPPSMQDTVLVFGYFLKRDRDRHLFRPAEVKTAFKDLDRKVPRSLLQILGALKRDRGLLCCPGGKRGEYALTPTGIRHVEGILGVGAPVAESPPAPSVREEPAENAAEQWDRLFKPRGGSGWRPAAGEGGGK